MCICAYVQMWYAAQYRHTHMRVNIYTRTRCRIRICIRLRLRIRIGIGPHTTYRVVRRVLPAAINLCLCVCIVHAVDCVRYRH